MLSKKNFGAKSRSNILFFLLLVGVFALSFAILRMSATVYEQNQITSPPPSITYLLYTSPSPAAAQSNTNTVSVNTISEYTISLSNNQSLSASQQEKVPPIAQPSLCAAEAQHLSPDEKWDVIEYNCHARSLLEITDLTTGQLIATQEGFFLTWLHNSDSFLFKRLHYPAGVYAHNLATSKTMLLPLPKDTYAATVQPDQPKLIFYAASRGLGLGSELGVFDSETAEYLVAEKFPDKIIAQISFSEMGFPSSSQNGLSSLTDPKLLYVTIPDSNIPYQMGELWVADIEIEAVNQRDFRVVPHNTQFLAEIDGGHGFAAKWSPDKSTIAFVQRENPEDINADHIASALHSNIYLVDVTSKQISQLTDFEATVVYDIAWSPQGDSLAFTANDGIWVSHLNGEYARLTDADVVARHPVWLRSP